VKQKEAENKTKQSPDSSPNSAYAFLFSSSLTSSSVWYCCCSLLSLSLPLYRRRKIYAQPISLKEIATSDAGPFKIDLRLFPHQECKRREPGKEEIAS